MAPEISRHLAPRNHFRSLYHEHYVQFSYKGLLLNGMAMAADRFCWLFGVALGAIGAHAMAAASATDQVGFETAVRYHLLHSITAGLALVLHAGRRTPRRLYLLPVPGFNPIFLQNQFTCKR